MASLPQTNAKLVSLIAFLLVSNVVSFTHPSQTTSRYATIGGNQVKSPIVGRETNLHMGFFRCGRAGSSSSIRTETSNTLFGRKYSNVQRCQKSMMSMIPSLIMKLRRSLSIMLTSALLLFGPMSNTPLLHRPTAHASTLTASPQAQKTLDKLIDNYVQKHMFDDDKYDPLESTYREIVTDSSIGEYPNALSSIASNLGATQTTSSSGSSAEQTTANSDGIMKMMLKFVNTLETKYNLPRSVLVPVIALLAFGVPSIIIFMGLMSFSYAQKGMTERMAIERYGESVLDAEELVVEEDEDDDYDYESGEYEDDDDDDEVS